MADSAFSVTADSELTVAILLCTYNGEKFLQAQLDSIAKQSHQNWCLFVSDDGSTDRTLDLIERFSNSVGTERVQLFSGPGRGFAQNFLSLLARPQIDVPYIAFADQDDIWLPEKLARALSVLQSHRAIPALYAGRTRYIDEQDQILGESTLFLKPPCFANALVQSIGGGNTIMINHHVFKVMRTTPHPIDIYSHDWWFYLLVSALGGSINYDPQPYVLYRQHSANVVGMNTTWKQKWLRIQMLLAGDFAKWNDRNIASLEFFRPQMSTQIQQIFDTFVRSRKQGLLQRVFGMKAAGVYRQTTLGNAGLWFAIITKKI
jgi:glycosyltransferase involved in cell wall biosynthesis